MNLSNHTPADNGGILQQNLSGHVGALGRAGYGHALHAVIPPGGKTTPTSKIAPDQLGKIPGRWDPAGWHGYNWRQEATPLGQLARELQRGGNLGMQTFDVPFVDVDVSDPEVSTGVEAAILEALGPSPKRTGRAPKFAMPFRLDGPRFSKIVLHLSGSRIGSNEKIEILADGAQVVIGGIHPGTLKPYYWSSNGREGGVEILAGIPAASLPPISPAIITERLLPSLREKLSPLGVTVALQGSGVSRADKAPDQESLRAPSLDVLRSLIVILPNDADYDAYIETGIAIKAAAGTEHEVEARELWFDWCARHEGGNDDPEVNVGKWDSFKPPHHIGWGFLKREARRHGINTGVDTMGLEPDPAAAPDPLPPPPDDMGFTDMGNGARFARRYRGEVIFVAGRGWMVWSGMRWTRDRTGAAVMRHAKQIARDLRQEAKGITDPELRDALLKHARRSESDARLRAMLAQAQPELTVEPSALDADPWLFNVANGTLDLRTGALLPHDPKQLITKLAPVAYDPDATAPRWRAFLERIFAGDQELIGFFQRALGYSLTGDMSEQVLFVAHGSGQNGKSVAFNTVRDLLGDYALQAAFETFLRTRRSGGPRPDLAALPGARFVSAIEANKGARLDESTVKQVTGGDPITTRDLYQAQFTFSPVAKLWLIANHRPEVDGSDFGMWRRIRLVPFDVTIPEEERNRNLIHELREEWPGILAWLIQGALAWRQQGLGYPARVQEATDGYRADSDKTARFVRDCCIKAPATEVGSADLYAAYTAWCAQVNEIAESQREFNEQLASHEPDRIRRVKSNGRMIWRGIELRPAVTNHLEESEVEIEV